MKHRFGLIASLLLICVCYGWSSESWNASTPVNLSVAPFFTLVIEDGADNGEETAIRELQTSENDFANEYGKYAESVDLQCETNFPLTSLPKIEIKWTALTSTASAAGNAQAKTIPMDVHVRRGKVGPKSEQVPAWIDGSNEEHEFLDENDFGGSPPAGYTNGTSGIAITGLILKENQEFSGKVDLDIQLVMAVSEEAYNAAVAGGVVATEPDGSEKYESVFTITVTVE